MLTSTKTLQKRWKQENTLVLFHTIRQHGSSFNSGQILSEAIAIGFLKKLFMVWLERYFISFNLCILQFIYLSDHVP